MTKARLSVFLFGTLSVSACDLDLLTGTTITAMRDGGIAGDVAVVSGLDGPAEPASSDAPPDRLGGDAEPASDGGATVTPDGSGGAAVPPFFPTMFVTIDGIRKSYRLSYLSRGAVMINPVTTGADMVRLEFATGFRNLGAEATPGERYSEIWLSVTTGGGQTPVAGPYDCLPAGSSPLPGQRALQVTWSFNHGIVPMWTDYSTFPSGGPCTATFQDFGTAPGDRIRGTFAATVDGGHVLSEGAFDLVVPDTIVPGQP